MSNLVKLYKPAIYYRQLKVGDQIIVTNSAWRNTLDLNKKYFINRIEHCVEGICDRCMSDHMLIAVGTKLNIGLFSACDYNMQLIDGTKIISEKYRRD